MKGGNIIHMLIAAVITVKVMEIVDKEGGYDPVYLALRPLLVSSLLCFAYQPIRAESK